jgi:hypothetical protein
VTLTVLALGSASPRATEMLAACSRHTHTHQ